MELIGPGVVALIGLWLTYHVGKALRTGSANVHNKIIKRQSQAAYFWSAVLVQAGFAALCYAFAVVRVTKVLAG